MKKIWTTERLSFLTENAGNMTDAALTEELNKLHEDARPLSLYAVIKKRSRLNLKKYKNHNVSPST